MSVQNNISLFRGSELIVSQFLLEPEFGVDELIELTPGETYFLNVVSGGFALSEPFSTEFSMNFQTTEVIPEPGSGLLLGIGVVVISLADRACRNRSLV